MHACIESRLLLPIRPLHTQHLHTHPLLATLPDHILICSPAALFSIAPRASFDSCCIHTTMSPLCAQCVAEHAQCMQKLEQAFGGDSLSADDRFLKQYLLNEVRDHEPQTLKLYLLLRCAAAAGFVILHKRGYFSWLVIYTGLSGVGTHSVEAWQGARLTYCGQVMPCQKIWTVSCSLAAKQMQASQTAASSSLYFLVRRVGHGM